MENRQLDHSHHQPSNKKFPLSILAHDIELAMNVGSLFRIADALGVERIFLSGKSLIPPHSKIRKTSRATEQFVPFAYVEDPLPLVKQLKSEGYQVISLEITSSSIDIRELALLPEAKVCLVIGAENEGVSQNLLDLSDQTVHIPMLGHSSSMNVASACSIATFEITRRLESDNKHTTLS